AGPIERATNLLPQFLSSRRFDYARAVDGCRQMLWGFFKKMVIADSCAQVVNEVWNGYSGQSSLNLVIAATLFTFQIYCDFSGYSDIAIGTARLFGINLMQNFRYPYFARSIPEFWRRWHISLTSWFRDYVYIPLGGNRVSKSRTVLNTLVVFALSGLWHGANWTFVIWGLYHGILIALFVVVVGRSRYSVQNGKNRPVIKEFTSMIITFQLVVVGLIVFRAPSLAQAVGYLQCMFTAPLTVGSLVGGKTLAMCAGLLLVEWIQRDARHVMQLPAMKPFAWRWVRWMLYVALVLVSVFAQAPTQDFIYFQF
ncbi:MAG: MBOAT family protein, partial [Muribaculaceae bacterium]|nr:MBOAT family protein [Muribaculaceae bacterium]